MKLGKKKKLSKAFTLIEMLTTIAIFGLVIGATIGIFISVARSQKQILNSQQILDQTSYALEYMNRVLRMARKDLSGECLTTVGLNYNYETNPGGTRIRFLNYQNRCQEFYLENNQIKERMSWDNKAANFQSPYPLTSTDLQVSFLRFYLSGESQNDDLQPKITLSFIIKGKEGQPEIKIQTSISQRNLDVVF